MFADLESLAYALIGRFSREPQLWRSRRFHVFEVISNPVAPSRAFAHVLACGGL